MEEIYGSQYIALLKIAQREWCWWRLARATHIKGKHSETMMSKLTTKIENPSTRISAIGAHTMNNNDRALCRQVPIRENTRNEPTTQLYMIFSAGKGDVLELQPEIRRRP